jgi:hypothetical protein
VELFSIMLVAAAAVFIQMLDLAQVAQVAAEMAPQAVLVKMEQPIQVVVAVAHSMKTIGLMEDLGL